MADLRAVVPEHCFKPDPLRAWLTLARTLLLIPACLGALWLARPTAGWDLAWQVPVILSVWAVYGLVLLGLFVVAHDCGHGSFSNRGWVNNLVGVLCMSPLLNGFQTWKLTHNHHHAYTQLRGQEVDWSTNLVTRGEFAGRTWREDFLTRLGYALPFGLVVWITVNTVRRAVAVRSMVGERRYAAERWRLLLSNLAMILIYTAPYGAFAYTAGLWGMVYFHGVPIFLVSVYGATIITLGHANRASLIYSPEGWNPVRGQLAATQDIRFPGWVEALICHINIHIPHHVSTKIPSYRLIEAGEAIRAAYPDLYQEERFGWGHLAWFRRTPFLVEHRAEGYYEIDAADLGAAA